MRLRSLACSDFTIEAAMAFSIRMYSQATALPHKERN